MIKDSVYLVTGGASGLGRATVKHLLTQGAKVVFCDISEASKANAYEICDKFKNNAVFVTADVTSEDDIIKTLDITKEKFGRLNGLINCAAIYKSTGTYDFEKKEPHSLELFTRILTVNTVGTFNVVRLAVGLIAKNDLNENGERGVIINTSSVVAFDGAASRVAYSASKAAIAGMTMPLAKDLAEKQIRVVSIAPGFFDTPMTRALFSDWQTSVKAITEMLAFPKRPGNPTDFAEFVEKVIRTPMLNATNIRLDAGGRFF